VIKTVAIYAHSECTWAECLREDLRKAWIPCALIGPGYGFSPLAEKLPFLIIAPNTEVSDTFIRSQSAHKILTWSEGVSVPSLVREACRQQLGIDVENLREAGIRYLGDRILYRGVRMHFTPNELLILNLLLVCRGRYFSAEEISALCLRCADANASAVHICSINRKATEVSPYKIIECRRYKGYRIP